MYHTCLPPSCRIHSQPTTLYCYQNLTNSQLAGQHFVMARHSEKVCISIRTFSVVRRFFTHLAVTHEVTE